jgi:hypothetical protein
MASRVSETFYDPRGSDVGEVIPHEYAPTGAPAAL